ncbi:hypothetical protein ACFSTH_00025 [Paenibacillus yanchengensis]|uniref:ATLF-like domain-containing protein n=1 Tax=Paenibacillus yanchengensis TaxID=2035833 RepID=A0ABW4YEP0_9BACL
MNWAKRITVLLLASILLITTPIYASNNIIDKLVVLPKSKYNEQEANKMMERLNLIPTHILEKLYDNNVKIKLTNDIITKEPELSYLRGVTPRGWENTGLTWDDVPGVSEQIVVVRIGHSKKGKGHNSFNLEIHETMHAVDRLVFNGASSTAAFKEVFNKEANIKYKNDGYVSVYPEEYFAEAASLYVYSDTTNSKLKESQPLTYKFFEDLFKTP